MSYVPRALVPAIRRAMRTFPAVLVTDPRQAGGTTLLPEEFGASYRCQGHLQAMVAVRAHKTMVGRDARANAGSCGGERAVPTPHHSRRRAILAGMRFFNTTGPVRPGKHYSIPPLERLDLDDVLGLVRDERYFVLHAPRQTGKTSAFWPCATC